MSTTANLTTIALIAFLGLLGVASSYPHKDFCVVGGGPGGLNTACLLAEQNNDYVLFEKASNGGSFYRKYPIHRKLISINKRATSRGHSPEFNERHDWNSLLSSNDSLVVGQYSRKYYPHADELVHYLEDYSNYVINISPKDSMKFNTEVTHVSRTKGTGNQEYLDVHTHNINTGDNDVTTCHHVIWATGMQPKGLDFLIKGKNLDGVEFYSDVDPTSERYFNESIALVGGGNAGMEIATALQNEVGFIALMSDFQFSWRSHYVGDVRSVNAQFIDGYLLKSLDYINAGGRSNAIIRNKHGKLMLINVDPEKEKRKDSGKKGHLVTTAAGMRVEDEDTESGEQEPENDMDSGKMDAYELENESDACETGDKRECTSRIGAESGRSSILGFDRIIFCTGFRFSFADPPPLKKIKQEESVTKKMDNENKENTKKEEEESLTPGNPITLKKQIFDIAVRPELDGTQKYPKLNYDYSSRNVKGLYFAGALTHELDYKRGAGGFIHGFRYTSRALVRILNHRLPRQSKGSTSWPSKLLNKNEFVSGDHMLSRINSMAGPYQMFAELCDLIVFEADEKICKNEKKRKLKNKFEKSGGVNEKKEKEENNIVFAKYYEEMPVSFMAEFVTKHLKKSKYMSVCFEYGHGKFSDMDTLHHKYIGTRFGPIAESIGMPHLMDQDGGGDPFGGRGTSRGTNRPSKRMGPTGAGVDSNFLHPVISLYDTDDEESIESVEKIAKVMYDDDTHLFKMAKMQHMQQARQGGDGQGGGDGVEPYRLLAMATKSHHIFYPIATHHLLEDLDTMWNLWYTHKLPLKWWLEDRSDPCNDLMKRSNNSKEWNNKKRNEHFNRLSHQVHVEVFCKSYEYERYLVRTNRGDDNGNWKRPSDLGHVHRIPLKYNHFDLMPDGDVDGSSSSITSSSSSSTGTSAKSLTKGEISESEKPKIIHEDRLRKERHLGEKKEQLRQQKQQKQEMMFAKTEATRYRARASDQKFEDMFVKSAANVKMKEMTVGADGATQTVSVRGISLDDI